MSVWLLEFDGFDHARVGLREALCTLGNGYLATRGADSEARADGVHYPGTYVAGVFNRLSTDIAGRTIEDESIVNLPNWLPLTFHVGDGCWLDAAELLESHHELDLRRGVLARHARIRDDAGRITRLTQRRLVSMDDPHLAALETSLVAENWSGPLQIRSRLDADVTNSGVARYRGLARDHLSAVETSVVDEETVALEAQTRHSHVRIAEAARTRLSRDGAPIAAERTLLEETLSTGHELAVDLAEGEAVTVEKVVAVYTSRDAAISEPANAARRALVPTMSFDELLGRHALAWHQLWQRFGVSLHQGGELDRADRQPPRLPSPADSLAAHRGPGRGSPRPRSPRRGLPRARLLGRALRLPPPEPAAAAPYAGPPSLPVPEASRGASSRPRVRSRRSDVPLAERK